MAVTAFDGQVVTKCRTLGLKFNPIDIESSDAQLLKCELPSFNPDWPDDVDQLFFGLLDAQMRHYGDDATLWIDCVGLRIPTFLTKAICHAAVFGMRIVVTHCDICSLSASSQLHHDLQIAIDSAVDGRKVWHPIEGKLVPAPAAAAGR